MGPSARKRATTAVVLGIGNRADGRLRVGRGASFVVHGSSVVGEDGGFFASLDEHDNVGTSAPVDNHDASSPCKVA